MSSIFNEASAPEHGYDIADIVLAAELNGTESHGVQRMVRYAFEIDPGLVQIDDKPGSFLHVAVI